MLNRIIFSIAIILFVFQGSAKTKPEWGPTGHRTVAKIAENHLTNKAKKQINLVLQGQSLAFVSTYGDEIKSDKKYKKFLTWHFVNFPFDSNYENSKKNPKGDIIIGINYCLGILKNKNSTIDEQQFYLKLLIHLIGDLHQPLHVGKLEDKGANNFPVRWHNKGSNLHRVWDSQMIESWNMSYTELADNAKILNKQQKLTIEKGTLLDWIYETQKLAKKAYTSASLKEKLGYKYSYDHFGTVRSQLQKAGIRLAKILNEIYD